MKIRRKMRHKRNHSALWVFTVTLLAVCVIGFGTYQGVMAVVNSWLEDLPSVENSDAFNYTRKTKVYAGDETTLLAEFYLENREPVTIDQVTPYVLEGTVATEDERFYEHDGVDLPGIARALVVNLSGSNLEGASTITMQFVRNTILADEANEISFKRKVREAQLAINLEDIYTKDEILMMYLNTINYGDGCWGIEAAAKNYFQKGAGELTITEAATLVAIPQSPTYLNPKENPDACLSRRNLVLERMLKYGSITQEEYDSCVAEPLTLNPAPDSAADGIYAYPYFTSYVKKLLLEQYSDAEVFKGGLTVYTTIDPTLQYIAETSAEEEYAYLDGDIEISLVSVDPSTGYIKAMLGGKDYYADQTNVATGNRQPGSTFKVFTLVTAIEDGISPETKIDCSTPYTTSDGTKVPNYGGADYGVRTIQNATAISSNTGYLRLADQVGIPKTNQTAHRMGITSTLGDWSTAPLGVNDVSVLEMASSYATLAADGVYREPVAITKINSWDGETIFEHVDEPTQVISNSVAYATTKVLQTVLTEGTAAGHGLNNGQPSAGKTGTTDDNYDKWFVGYTPQLSTAVWVGVRYPRDIGSAVRGLSMWQSFMNRALADQPVVNFTEYPDPEYKNTFNEKQSELYDPKTPADAPSAVGMTLEEAAIALDGFDAVYYEEYSDTVAIGTVIRQETTDTQVILYVSKGPDPNPNPKPTDGTGDGTDTNTEDPANANNTEANAGGTPGGTTGGSPP